MQWLTDRIEKESAVIKKAPLAFFSGLICAAALIAMALTFCINTFYSERIEILNASLESYKIRLEGATPEEAQKRILSLERKLKDKEARDPTRIACVSPDIDNLCDHPTPPDKPYTDLGTAQFMIKQSETIDKCRALLNKPVATHLITALPPASIMTPPSIPSFIGEIEYHLEKGVVNSHALIDLAEEADITRLKLEACQSFIKKTSE